MRPFRRTIANRLGWLTSPLLMADSIERLLAQFAASVKSDGFTDVVLLGMGGSSLAPEVLRAIARRRAGLAALPHARLDRSGRRPRRRDAAGARLCICWPASRERRSSRTRWPRISAAADATAGVAPSWADHFVAITDEGTELATRARAERFRDVFINPSDIGGRYSALSFFGWCRPR